MSVAPTDSDVVHSSWRVRIDWNRLTPIALSQAIGLACGVTGATIASHWITPADYGAFGLFLACAPLGMWVVHAGLLKGVSRQWASSTDRPALLREALTEGARRLPWLALATAVAACFLDRSHWLSSWLALFVASTLLSCGSLAQIALQAVRRHWADLAVSAAGSISRTFLPLLLYIGLNASVTSLQLGFVGHACLLAFTGGLLLKTLPASRTSSPRILQLDTVYRGSLFLVLAIAAWSLSGATRWIAAGYFDGDTVGYFTFATNLAVIATGMPGIIATQYAQPGLFAAPHVARENRLALARRVDRIALVYTAVSIAAVFSFWIGTPWLVGSLIGRAYEPALDYLASACGFGMAVQTAQFYHLLLLAGKRERACGPVDLLTSALLIAGAIVSAALKGEDGFLIWLGASPLTVWLITRPFARRLLLQDIAADSPKPGAGR